MSLRSSPNRPPWGTLFFALLGLLWSGYIAFPSGGADTCISSGCSITRDFSIWGISLWWLGGAYFFVLMVVCLRGMRLFAWRLAQLALALDSLLLLLMFFTGPCFDCLVVAVFFFLTAFCLRPSGNSGWFRGEQAAPFVFFPLWAGLFFGNIVVGLNETTPHWTIGNPEYDNVRVYFAPSCPACREALKALGSSAVLFPVVEDENDFDSLLRLESLLSLGMGIEKAIDESLNQDIPTPSISFMRSLYLKLQLIRNKSFVLKHNFKAMPLIEINGMPRSWIAHDSRLHESQDNYPAQPQAGERPPLSYEYNPPEENNPPQSSGNLFDQNKNLWGEEGFSQCEDGSLEPCPE